MKRRVEQKGQRRFKLSKTWALELRRDEESSLHVPK